METLNTSDAKREFGVALLKPRRFRFPERNGPMIVKAVRILASAREEFRREKRSGLKPRTNCCLLDLMP